MRTQVGIVGAGPSGLLLSQLLHLQGIESVVLEHRSQEYVLSRIRAGVLEQGTVAMLENAGVGARMRREGLVHEGIEIAFNGERHRIHFQGLVGSSVMVYGQTEVTRDLMDARAAVGGAILYEAEAIGIEGIDTDRPRIRYRHHGQEQTLDCEFVAGCDGYHGVSRRSLPPGSIKTYERVYPFGWLGILSRTAPVSHELIYARHDNGFALASMRSPTLSRYYIQCAADEDLNKWPDEKFWDELAVRLGPEAAAQLERGPSIEKSVAPLRSFVATPLRFGRMFLAGDAAHIVPPTGAKGLNLAASDVHYLWSGLVEHYKHKSSRGLDTYSENCLRRIWKAERFSWWMTGLLHKFPETGEFGAMMQLAELDYLSGSKSAQAALAENYVGLPL
jgi:p-hydroxybenzoate 3-monooxygenase